MRKPFTERGSSCCGSPSDGAIDMTLVLHDMCAPPGCFNNLFELRPSAAGFTGSGLVRRRLLSRPTRLTFSTLLAMYIYSHAVGFWQRYGKKCIAYSDGHGKHAKLRTDIDAQTTYALLVRNFQ